MTDILDLPSIWPILPELVLVLGAMALLMFGVTRGDRSTPTVCGLAIVLLIVAVGLLVMQPSGTVDRKSVV